MKINISEQNKDKQKYLNNFYNDETEVENVKLKKLIYL